MSRRIISLVLCMVMMVGILPTSFADGADNYSNTDQIADEMLFDEIVEEPVIVEDAEAPASPTGDSDAVDNSAMNVSTTTEESAIESVFDQDAETDVSTIEETAEESADDVTAEGTVPQTEADAETVTPVIEEQPAAEPVAEEPATESTTDEDVAAAELVEEEPTIEEPETEATAIFDIDGDELKAYNGKDAEVTVPDGIRVIGKKAFYGNKKIKKIILPDSVEVIKAYAFAKCINLEKVVLGEQSKLKTIAKFAFQKDKKLDYSFAQKEDLKIIETAFDGVPGAEELFVKAGEEAEGGETEEVSLDIAGAIASEELIPVFTLQPVSVEAAVGDAVSFRAEAGEGVSYQWQESVDNGETWDDIDWAESTSNVIELTVHAGLAGRLFHVIAMNQYGAATSENASVIIKESLLSDGNWVYRVVDGYAEVAGYLDKSATSLSIPDRLGGCFVNAIGEGAFADLEGLTALRVHGNVIVIRDNAFANKNVTLSGYNGTTVLAWAKENGYSYNNLTHNDYFTFQEHVIDYTYADTGRYAYVNETTLKMRPAEAAQLAIGSIFYEPIVYGNLAVIYKVTGLQEAGDWIYISVAEADPEESLLRIRVSDDNMYADWSRAEWADGVEVKQEKFEASAGFNGTLVDITYKKPLGQQKTKSLDTGDIIKYGKTPFSFFVNFNLSVKATAAIDYEIHLLKKNELHELSFTLEPSVTIKTGFKAEYDNKDSKPYNYNNGKFDRSRTIELVQPAEYMFKIGSVPIVSGAKIIEVRAAVYIKITASGEIEVIVKGSGKLGLKWNESKKDWEHIKNWTWQPPSISGAIEISFGPVEAVELHAAILGKVISVELFEGVVLKFTVDGFLGGSIYDEETGEAQNKDPGICANVRADAKVTLDFKITLDLLADILKGLKMKTGFSIDLLSIKLFEKHWELGKGFLDKCTYSNSFTVDFYTGTAEDVPQQSVKGGGKAKEPTLKDPPGTLEGWFEKKDFSGNAWNFSTNTVKKNTTLYAKWDVPQYTVKYKCYYDDDDFEETAYQGAKLKEPDKLRRLDYRFEGWYKEKECNNKWDFSTDTMPGSDLTLHAKWVYEQGYDPFQEDYQTSGQGDVVFSGNGHSYTHIMEYKSYQEALAHATRLGGYLATINSEAEQQFLANYLYQDCAQQYLWLGMVSQDNWDHWATGEKVSYQNWNSTPTTTSTQFNAALIRTSGKWTTLSNSDTAHYVIEWGAPDVDPDYGKNTAKDDIQYTVDSSKNAAYVVGWNNDAENLTISSRYNGLEVKGIVADAFKGNTTVKTIFIPNSVTSIGNNAFMNCSSLERITVPNSVTSIGTSVFENCEKLNSVQWSSGLNVIPNRTFYGDPALQTVSGTENVITVGDYAFYYCSDFTGGVPIKAETIGSYAYYGNSSMQSILLPESVRQISYSAFQNCTGAKTITVSEKMTSIPSSAFYNCNQAVTVNLPDSITSISSNAFNNVNGTFRVYANSYAENWCRSNNKTTENLSGKYRVVYAIENPTEGNKDGEMTDEAYVKYGARLAEPEMSIEGKTIEGWYLDPEYTQQWSFANDRMPDHNITLYAKMTDSQELFDYDVADNQAVITGYYGNATNVTIPAQINGYSVTKLAENSIVSDTITELTIPATVQTIEGGAINCGNLYNIRCLGDDYLSVHNDGILYSADGRVLIYAPQGREYNTYEIPDGVTTICKRVFYGQRELGSVTIPESVTTIDAEAFEGNTLLHIYGSTDPESTAYQFALENGFTYNIYSVLYYYGDNIVYSANFEAGTPITDYYKPTDSFSIFGGWYTDPGLTEAWDFTTEVMPASNLNLYLKWDSLFAVDLINGEITINGYQGTAKAIIIPEEINGYPVTGIAKGALTKATITSVTIPDCVSNIASGAIGANVKVIGNKGSAAQQYANANGLTFTKRKYVLSFDSAGGSAIDSIKLAAGAKATLPVPVRSNYMFMGWYTDTSYTDESRWTDDTVMPANDVTLCAYWKSVNTNISNDYSYAILADGTVEITNYTGNKVALSIPSKINGYTVSRIGAYAFSDNETLTTVTIPASVTSIGEYAFANSSVKTVKGAKNVETIEECAFMNAVCLSSVYISATVSDIGDSAFMYCRGLTSVTLRAGTETIGNRAFFGCTYLESVSVPTTVRQIGKEAFGQCPRLKKLTVPNNLINDIESATDSTTKITLKDSATVRILSIERDSGTKLTLTWNKVANAAKYLVYRMRESDTKFKKISTEYTDPTATISGNTTGTTVQYYIKAVNEDGDALCQSETVSYYVSALQQPEISSVTQKNAGSAVMKLNGVDDADGYIIYRADAAEGPYTKLKTTTAVSFTNTGLTPGHDYYYKIRAYQTVGGEKIYSNDSEVYHFHMPYKYLMAPQNVSAMQTAPDTVTLTWDKAEDAEGYSVYRKTGSSDYELIGTTYAEGFADSRLVSGQKYYYRIAGYFAENGETIEGAKSSTVSLTLMTIPTPGIQEVIQKQSGTITVAWSAVDGATGYVLERAEDGGAFAEVKTTTGTAYTDSAVAAGKTYSYRVRAYKGTKDTGEYSNYSRTAEYKMPTVATVTALKATQSSGTSAKATWKKLNNVTGYEVWVSANNENNFVLTVTSTTASAVLDELHDGVSYYVKVRAYTGEGAQAEFGEFSEIASVTIIGTPVIEVAEQFGTRSARLIWTKVNSADGYEVWRKVAGEASYSLIRTLDVTNLINTWLTVGVKHSYKVRAYRKTDDGVAYGSFSGVKTILPLATPALNPIVRATATKVTVSWGAVDSATGYVLYMSNEEKGVYTEVATTDALKYSVSGLTADETYYFKVVPYVTISGNNQFGKESGIRGIRMLAKPKVTSVEKSAENQLAITWNPIDGAAKYSVSYGTAADALTSQKTTTNTTIKLSSLEQNTRYYYSIKAYTEVLGDECSSLASTTGNYYLSDLPRAAIKSFAQPNSTSLTVTWGEVEGADGYELSRSDAEDGAYSLVKRQTATSYTEKELTAGGIYYYKVRAYKLVDDARVYGRYSAIRMVILADAVAITSLEIINNKSVVLQWEAAADAVKYNVYRSVNGEAYTLLKGVTTTSYTDSTCTAGNKYTYKVELVLKPSVTQTAPRSSAKSVYFGGLAAVTVSKLTQPNTGSVKITWKAVSGATGYQIYAAEGANGTMKKVLTATSNYGTVTGLNGGSDYRFMVRAYVTVDETNYYGPFSAEQNRNVLAVPADVKLVETATDRATLTWEAVNGATSYQVWRKAPSDTDYVKIKTISDGSTSYTNTGLETGATYSYKVRALRTTDAGTDISWSGIKKIKIINFTAQAYPESSHDYTNNMNETWTYTISGASALALTFSGSTAFEGNYDKLYITDKDGNAVGSDWYSSTTLAGKTIIVPGNTVNLRMTSDGSVTKYGFSFDSILPAAK